jgi:signal transduction histidine kinase
VNDLVERASAACAHELNDSGCDLVKDLDPDLPPVDADRTALVHALRNLVSNAATHGGRGEPIHVRARNLGDAVEIEVSDGGPGIEPAEINRIFDPFYRGGRRARESQTRGLGLGLSLVKRIIEAHGGSIVAANNPGRAPASWCACP